jgi:DMSO/TMAO reductase YedYZ molybdopterin-dependent catalytic subunit
VIRVAWVPSVVLGGLATAVALLLQNLLRDTWQIRTLPERVMEWALLFIPLDLFERGLARFGADAKGLALMATFAGMAVGLVAIGTLAVRMGLPSERLLGLGVGMWLFTMAVVMPISGAGLFATGLLIAPLLTNAGYALVFLGYATVLIGGRFALLRDVNAPVMAERRALLAGVVGTLAASGLATLAGREGGVVTSGLPVAAAPTAIPPLAAAPTAIPPLTPATPPTATSAAPIAQPASTPLPTLEPLPNPPPRRRLARDKDGSLTAAGRAKGELAPPITSNDDFYVVTKNAIQDPVVDVTTWRLVIDGEVSTPVQLDYRTLRALPPVEVTKTLECISNFTSTCNLTSFGCDLLSTARWRGARLSDVLELAGGLKASAGGLACLSSDEFSAGLPTDVAHDPETLVVYEMNGEPLPREHGFPARLLVPGRYGMKNPKWLAGIRATTQEYAGWYEQRNWNKDGIVKTMSRIDTPADGAVLTAGAQRVAGIAYAGDRGISQVELTSDGGSTWVVARILEAPPGKDAMVRWESTFVMPYGPVTLTVRATDGAGQVQTEEFQLPQPDGASGRDSITLSAA